MKRLFWLPLILCLSLCACGGNSDTETLPQDPISETQAESPKGTLDNPYRVGETIVLDEIYPFNEHPANQTPFGMELTVTEVFSPDESISSRFGKQLPVARLSVCITGNYEDPIELNQFFYRPLLTTNLEKEWPLLFFYEGPSEEVTALTPGEKYDLLLTVYQADEAAPLVSYPYLMISYYPDSSTINDVYIDLVNDSSSTEVEEEISTLPTEEQAQYYQAAVAAEEKGYYAVAENLYDSIPGYKDTNARRQSVLTNLAPYNGTYYGESYQHEGVSLWIYVQDGTVWATYDVENTPVLEYELYQYGTNTDGTPIMAFAPGLTRFFLDNQNASYTHGFTMTQNGDLWIVATTEGGHDTSWNGALKKVSDTVDEAFG